MFFLSEGRPHGGHGDKQASVKCSEGSLPGPLEPTVAPRKHQWEWDWRPQNASQPALLLERSS